MFKKIAFITFILFHYNICLAQNEEQKILIYAEKEDYLMPLIEKKLSEIKYLGKDNKIFNKVTNFNRITSNIANERILNNAVKYHSGLNIALTDSMKRVQNSIVDLIKKNDLFLQVKINTLNNLLEYQFFLYKISSTSFPTINTADPISTFNTFIDIQNDNYDKKIGDAIKAIFPKSNARPNAQIDVIGYEPNTKYLDREHMIENIKKGKRKFQFSYYNLNESILKSEKEIDKLRKQIEVDEKRMKEEINKIDKMTLEQLSALLNNSNKNTKSELYQNSFEVKIAKEIEKYYVPLNTTIQLSSFKSSDLDTPKEFLSYSWKVLDDKDVLLISDFQFVANRGQCTLIFFSEKTSKIELTVSDGISESKDTVIFCPVQKKTLYIPPKDREFVIFNSKSLFKLQSDEVYSDNDYSIDIYTANPEKIDVNRLGLSTVNLSFDTLNIFNYRYKKAIDSKTDSIKVKYEQFKVNDNRINLSFSHFKGAEGRYQVNYYDNGIIYKSNDININKVQVGIFSFSYLYNFSNILGKKFTEVEYSFSGRIFKEFDIYASIFGSNTLMNTDSLNIKKSYEFGIRNYLLTSDMSPLRKNIFDISYGLFLRNYHIQNISESFINTNIGLSFNLSLWGSIKKRFVYSILTGFKASYHPNKDIEKDFLESRIYLGVGIHF